MKEVDVPALTGLRGLAALWVVGYHFDLWFPTPVLPDAVFGYGFLGVDVFFLLSGYLLASLHIDLAPAGWGEFFRRRAFRVYPLHVVIMLGLAALVAAAHFRGLDLGPYYDWSSFPSVLFMAQIFTGHGGWNDPTWSVGAELVSYLLLPLAVFPLRHATRLAAGIACAALLGLDAGLVGSTTLHHGAILYTAIAGPAPVMRGLLGFFAGAAFSRCVEMRKLRLGAIGAALSWWPLLWVGEVSYSIYLLHGPILCKPPPEAATRCVSDLSLV